MKGLSLTEPMVKVWLAGKKTVHRIPMNPQPGFWVGGLPYRERIGESDHDIEIKPRYLPGETAYIKETWAKIDVPADKGKVKTETVYKASDWKGWLEYETEPIRWKSPRFMPETASRSRAKIVSVRPERVHDITEEEAIKEGTTASIVGADLDYLRYRAGFQTLWETLHPGIWDQNPWVWRIELKKEGL